MQKIKVLINGAHGKMGATAVAAIKQDEAFDLISTTDKGDDVLATIKTFNPDVLIDFTNAASLSALIDGVISANLQVRFVIGTTGLSNEYIKKLENYCNNNRLGGMLIPNFSISALLMMHAATFINKYLKDVEIIEFHNPGKLDFPSGTAIKTAQILDSNTESKNKDSNCNATKTRGVSVNDIAVHSVRLPGVVARQDIIFGNLGETLTISHATINREAFMPGLVMASKKIIDINYFTTDLFDVISKNLA